MIAWNSWKRFIQVKGWGRHGSMGSLLLTPAILQHVNVSLDVNRSHWRNKNIVALGHFTRNLVTTWDYVLHNCCDWFASRRVSHWETHFSYRHTTGSTKRNTHTHTHQHAYVHNLTQTRTPHTTHTHTIHHTQGLALNLCLMCHRLARKAGADFSDLQRIIFKSWQANTTLRYSKYILIYTIYTKIWAHLQQSTRKVDASYKKQGRKFPACSRLQRGKKEKAD